MQEREFGQPLEMSRLRASGSAQEGLHEEARAAREGEFGKRVFVRGVVEVSNYCRENCAYCGMRRDNRALRRYRLPLEPLLELLLGERPGSVTDINIQTGEDPVALREIVLPLVRELRARTSLGVGVCLGTHSEGDYAALREAGADYYVIKVETGNAGHYARMKAPGTLEERVGAIRHLAATGWNVSSGLIAGLPGQGDEGVLETVGRLRELPLAGWSVSPFIPGEQTPLEGAPAGSLERTLNCLALMRLCAPARIIPAVSAMNLAGPGGYGRALAAGANLATINLTPDRERRDYLLYRRKRHIMTEEAILREIEAAGCEPGCVGISQWLAGRGMKAGGSGEGRVG